MSRRPSKEELIERVGMQFRLGQNRSNAFDQVAAGRLGINLTDLGCLDIIQRLGRATAGEIARDSGLTSGAVTAVIDRLEQAGYARRIRDEVDRRRVFIELTPKAERHAGEIYGPVAEDWQAQMRRLTVEQLELLLDFMSEGNEISARHIARVRREMGLDSGAD